MELQSLIYLFVGISFALYIAIAIWTRAGSTKEFYVAGGGVHPIANGMATGADWMSAASFISLAGIVSLKGSDGAAYLMGWTGGYVLLAMLLAPYLRKFGKFTVPDFVGDRYYSDLARTVAVICNFISFTYVAGQMRGVGIVFSRFLQVDINTGVIIGMAIVFIYAVLGGMKGITYTQVAQYCVMIFAFTVPAIFLSLQVTDNFLPQIGFGSTIPFQFDDGIKMIESNTYLLHALDQSMTDLGFAAYTVSYDGTWNVFMLTTALMLGTAGLPHVIVRFFTTPTVKGARMSAGWALVFIAILYTQIPAVASFARVNLIKNLQNVDYAKFVNGEATNLDGTKNNGTWFKTWENSGLIGWTDRNGDGKIQFAAGKAFEGAKGKPVFADGRGVHGERLTSNPMPTHTKSAQEMRSEGKYVNELYLDRDIIVLANPEIAGLPNWVIAIIAAGGLAAALSTAAGLLLVISTSISHDLLGNVLMKDPQTGRSTLSEKAELMWARVAAVVAIIVAGYLGINPPGFVAQVVAFAFGLAAASFFPAIILGIFYKRMNKEGAIAGMLTGLIFTFGYIVYFVFMGGDKADYLWGIAPTGIGTIGMILHFIVAIVVSSITPPPPQEIQELVENIRIPRGAGSASAH